MYLIDITENMSWLVLEPCHNSLSYNEKVSGGGLGK